MIGPENSFELSNYDLSIIVTVHNTEKFIRPCIESVIAQTCFNKCEVLLIDDGSTDKSLEICREYANQYPNIRVFSQENKGVSIARNLGIRNVGSPYFMFLDGDDWLDSDCAESYLKVAKETNSDICIGDFYASYPSKEEKTSFFNIDEFTDDGDLRLQLIQSCLCPSDISNDVCVTNCGVVWARIYRTEFVIENRLEFVPGLKRMQDAIFNLDAFSKAGIISYFDYAGLHYRIYDQSATRNVDPSFSTTAQEILDHIEMFAIRENMEEELRDVYWSKAFKLFVESVKKEVIGSVSLLSAKSVKRKTKELLDQKAFSKSAENAKDAFLSYPEAKARRLVLKKRLYSTCFILFLQTRLPRINKLLKKAIPSPGDK